MKHIVGFSGGIDSQRAALWVRELFPAEDIILLNSPTGGNEHPVTTAFIEQYSREVFPVIVVDNIVSDLWKTEGWADPNATNGRSMESVPKTDRYCFDAGKGYLIVRCQPQTAHELAVIAVGSVKPKRLVPAKGCQDCFEFGGFTFSNRDGEIMPCDQLKGGKPSGCRLADHATLDDVANFIIQHYKP